MLEWKAQGPPNADKPHAILSQFGERIEAVRLPDDPIPDKSLEITLLRFYAPDRDSAVRYFQGLIRDGIKKAQPVYQSITKSAGWRFRGVPSYLNPQGLRLRVAQIIVDRAKDNKEIWRINTLLSQLCEAYQSMRKKGQPVPNDQEKIAANRTLNEARKDADRLHVLAATADAMIGEACEAYEIPQAPSERWVASIYDEPKVVLAPPEPPAPPQNEAPPEPEKPVEPPAPEQPKHPSPPRHHNPNRGK